MSKVSNKLKVLEISAALDGGGVDRLLFEFCSRLSKDIHFDFVVTSPTKGILEDPLEKLGCRIYHIPQMSGNLINYVRDLQKIMLDGHYDIVHDHMNQATAGSMLVAKFTGIKVRIAHAHTYNCCEGLFQKIRRKCMVAVAKLCATDLCACGILPGQWLWGKRCFARGKVYIMRNAIQLTKFFFSQTDRDAAREELGLQGYFVVGHVGRFSAEKNHRFLLEVFKEITMLTKSKLLLIGRGPLEDDIKRYANELGIGDNVLFLGIREDISRLMSAMDSFVLPSVYEGFPVTLVEAQTNGLPTIVSDVVSDECRLLDNSHYLSLQSGSAKWAQTICACDGKRMKINKTIMEYDVNQEAKRLLRFYHFCLQKQKST